MHEPGESHPQGLPQGHPPVAPPFPSGPEVPAGRRMTGAIYARYSTDLQQATSIDDQVRACRAVASRLGVEVPDELIFADAAVSGSDKGLARRDQYHALRAAVRAGRVDVVFCDQVCRLGRHDTELLIFRDEMRGAGARIVTADGYDSDSPNSDLLYGVKSVFAQQFLAETRHRVRRGMIGLFERGGFPTAIPYGYAIDHERSARTGIATWRTEPAHAQVVQEVFRLRLDGMTLTQVAAVLNARHIRTPDDPEGTKKLFWRPSAIKRILQNPIYKGQYIVNFTRSGATRGETCQRLESALALVSSSDWAACQPTRDSAPGDRRKPRAQYAGGKHALAGVVTCGTCGVYLSCHHVGSDKGDLHCIQCEHATAVGVPGRQPLYVSIPGVRVLLADLIGRIVQGEALARYREILARRLHGDSHEKDVADARAALARAQRSRDRLIDVLARLDADDPGLDRRIEVAHQTVLEWQGRVADLEASAPQVDRAAIERQLAANLDDVVDAWLTDRDSPARTRALLRRIFPRIVLLGKPTRFTAIFRCEFAPGVMLAEATGTIPQAEGSGCLYLQLNTSGARSPRWTVEELTLPEALERLPHLDGADPEA